MSGRVDWVDFRDLHHTSVPAYFIFSSSSRFFSDVFLKMGGHEAFSVDGAISPEKNNARTCRHLF